MIIIRYSNTTHCPGDASLYVQFNYKTEYVDIVKGCQFHYYNSKLKEWEVDVTSIERLINGFCQYDDLQIIDNYQETTNLIDNLEIIDDFKTKPFPYQLDGIKYGINHDKWLLLDAPGLGKTLQIIYIAEQLYKQGKIEHCLIICGINTLKYNWQKEIEKHSQFSCRIIGEKRRKNGKVYQGSIQDRVNELKLKIDPFFVVINIETLRNDQVVKEINNGINKFDLLVVDEIHTCKSVSSQQGKNLLKLKKAKYKIGLTGTLIMNTPMDAFVPLKWIGKEKSSHSSFEYYYTKYGGLFNQEFVGYKNINILKQQLDEVSLRRRKDLIDLPEKTVIHEYIDMNDKQRQFYDNILNGIFDDIDKVNLDAAMVLAIMSRLRQATACPSCLTTINVESEKLLRTVDLCKQIIYNNDKVVVFSVFKESLRVLEKLLSEYHPLLCSGDVKDDIIQSNIEKFQTDNNSKIMLCTTHKMGTGVTLNSASYMIFVDCPWTAAECEQCEDRIHRIGSKAPVFIYYLWCNDSVDLDVKQIVEDKSMVGDYIVDTKISENFISRLKNLIEDLKNS